jgi:hypothetical protein
LFSRFIPSRFILNQTWFPYLGAIPNREPKLFVFMTSEFYF